MFSLQYTVVGVFYLDYLSIHIQSSENATHSHRQQVFKLFFYIGTSDYTDCKVHSIVASHSTGLHNVCLHAIVYSDWYLGSRILYRS